MSTGRPAGGQADPYSILADESVAARLRETGHGFVERFALAVREL
jgi:hypothetical protein